MDDFDLFDRIKQRDRSAFNTLFRKYYTALCRFSFATCLSQEDSEESVQEMFVNLWEKAPTIDISISVKAYLYTSTRHHTLNAIQKQQTELRHLNEYSEQVNTVDQTEERQDAEISELIQSGVRTLPDKCREIFILCKQEGLTYEEISAYLNVSEKTVDNQMGIALRKLREFLRPKINKLLILLILTLFT